MTDENGQEDDGSGELPNTLKGLVDHFNGRFDKLEANQGGGGGEGGGDKPPAGDGGAGDDEPEPKHGFWDKPLWGG